MTVTDFMEKAPEHRKSYALVLRHSMQRFKEESLKNDIEGAEHRRAECRSYDDVLKLLTYYS